MTHPPDDPRCPECGEPIGQRATYCMHCSADLTDERAAADSDADGQWDQSSDRLRDPRDEPADSGTGEGSTGDAAATTTDYPTVDAGAVPDVGSDQLLDPDGLVDNTLTVIVGIAGGIVVGILGTIVLLMMTGNAAALLFGFVAWLGATAHLVRRRTVQGAIARTGYAIAVVLLLVPFVALSPVVSVEGGLADRGLAVVVLFVFVAVPAAVAAGVGWLAARYVPEDLGSDAR